MKFLQNYEAKLTENKLFTLVYNKINDLITKILLLLVYETGYKGYSYSYFAKFCCYFSSKINNFLITYNVFREMTEFLIGMQVLTFLCVLIMCTV